MEQLQDTGPCLRNCDQLQSLVHEVLQAYQFLFCKKDASKIRIFLASNITLRKKNIHSIFVKIFQVLADEGMDK